MARRPRKRLRALLLRTLVPAIGTPLYRLLGWTWRYREVRKSIMDDAQASDRPVVGAFLHARTFQLLHYNSRPQHGRWVLMCSQSRDGEAMARVEEGLGYTVERGSSGGGGSRALVGMIKRLRKDSSWSTCLAVDGSRGPRGVAQLGVLTLAQRTGGVILPVAASSNASLVYRWSWDRTVLPLPFAPVHVVFGEAIEVPDGLDEAGMEDIRARLERRLLELHEEADRLSGFRDSVPLQASTEQAG